MKLAPKPTNTTMATILSSTITLFVSADSRIPRTNTTVSSMTIRNAGQLNPKCQPGGYNSLPEKISEAAGQIGGGKPARGGVNPQTRHEPHHGVRKTHTH